MADDLTPFQSLADHQPAEFEQFAERAVTLVTAGAAVPSAPPAPLVNRGAFVLTPETLEQIDYERRKLRMYETEIAQLQAEISARCMELKTTYARAIQSSAWDHEKIDFYYEEVRVAAAMREWLNGQPASAEVVLGLTHLKAQFGFMIGYLSALIEVPAPARTAHRGPTADHFRRSLAATRTGARSREVCAAPSRRRATTSARSSSSSDDGPSSDPPSPLELERHPLHGPVNRPMRRLLDGDCPACGHVLLVVDGHNVCVHRPCERWGLR